MLIRALHKAIATRYLEFQKNRPYPPQNNKDSGDTTCFWCLSGYRSPRANIALDKRNVLDPSIRPRKTHNVGMGGVAKHEPHFCPAHFCRKLGKSEFTQHASTSSSS